MGRGRASLKDFVISLSVHQVWRPLSLEAKKYENIGSVHGCSSRSEYFFPFFKSHSEPNSFSSAPQFVPLFGQLQSRDPPNLGPALGGPSQKFMGYGRIGGLPPPPFLSLPSFAAIHTSNLAMAVIPVRGHFFLAGRPTQPQPHKTLGSSWFFKQKKNEDGRVFTGSAFFVLVPWCKNADEDGEGRKWLLGPTFRLAERKNTRTEKKLKFRYYGGRWAGQDMEVGGVCSSLIAPFLENETEIHSPLHHHHLIPSLEGGGDCPKLTRRGGGIIRYGEVAINFNDSFSTVGTQVGKGFRS